MSRFCQQVSLTLTLSLNSSLLKIFATNPNGVNNPKKIIPNTIGFTIFPIKIPRLIQSLFIGERIFGSIKVIITKINANAENSAPKTTSCVLNANSPKITKTTVKKNPNFLLGGSSRFSNFILVFCLQ